MRGKKIQLKMGVKSEKEQQEENEWIAAAVKTV